MSSDGTRYYDGVTRYLSDEEQARGRAAIEHLETVWLLDPERAQDLERLHAVRFQLRLGYLPLRDLSWLRPYGSPDQRGALSFASSNCSKTGARGRGATS